MRGEGTADVLADNDPYNDWLADAPPDGYYDQYRSAELWMPGDLLPQGLVDFSAGLGDALLLGTGDNIRSFLNINAGIDQGSLAYTSGSYASFAAGGARIAYAGAVKGYSIAAPSGTAASAFRSRAKSLFRLGIGKGWRPTNTARYSSDAALRAAAGRTNPAINAYGAGVAGAGITNPN